MKFQKWQIKTTKKLLFIKLRTLYFIDYMFCALMENLGECLSTTIK